MNARTFTAALAVSGAAALAGAAVASAHTEVVTSSPKHGATVKVLPRTATITFSGPMGKAGKVRVTRNGKGNFARSARLAPRNSKRVVVSLKKLRPAAQRGVYRIVWRATAADGHDQRGVIAFRVGAKRGR